MSRPNQTNKHLWLELLLEDETTITITNLKYDKDRLRKVLVMMIIVDDKPFRSRESKLFNLFCKTLKPRHEKLPCNTIKRDCMKIYEEEKQKIRTRVNEVLFVLQQILGHQGGQKHYVDKNWKM